MILITGGTGLLGSHLLLQLILEGYEVKALKRRSSNLDNVLHTFSYYIDKPEEAFSKINWVESDLLDYDDIFNLLKDVDKVYHAAALVSFDPRNKKDILNFNVQGTANVVNACLEAGIKKLCFVSSTSAIGNPTDSDLADETTVWKSVKGSTVYGLSKFRSEMEVWRGIEEGLNAVIVNPSIIIGPGNWNRGSSAMFSAINKGLKYYTHGVTGYVDVRDVVKCMVALMEGDISGERFILSEGNYSYKEILETIASSLEKKPPYRYAGKILTNLARRCDWLRNIFLRNSRIITKETANALNQEILYSNEKIKAALPLTFTPIRKSINWVAECYNKIC